MGGIVCVHPLHCAFWIQLNLMATNSFLLAHWIWKSFVLTRLCYWIITLCTQHSCAGAHDRTWDWRGCNCVYCVGSTQQQTPHEKAPQSPTHQDRVRRRDRAGTESGARADVGRHPARRAADYHVLHRQDHQVSAGMRFCSRPGNLSCFLLVQISISSYILCYRWWSNHHRISHPGGSLVNVRGIRKVKGIFEGLTLLGD